MFPQHMPQFVCLFLFCVFVFFYYSLQICEVFFLLLITRNTVRKHKKRIAKLLQMELNVHCKPLISIIFLYLFPLDHLHMMSNLSITVKFPVGKSAIFKLSTQKTLGSFLSYKNIIPPCTSAFDAQLSYQNFVSPERFSMSCSCKKCIKIRRLTD